VAFSAKTLLIVGAGASAELDFPVGNMLKDKIRSCAHVSWNGIELTGIPEYRRLVEDLARVKYGGRLEAILASLKNVHENLVLSGSIDQFLSSHQKDADVVRLAKLAIAYEIAKAEQNSHLNENSERRMHTEFVQLGDTYLPRLWARLQNGQPIDEWQRFFENLKVITFNYDRVLEQFFSLALRRFCKVDPTQATTFVANLPILHVYGHLGTLNPASPQHCRYAPDRHSIIEASERILTFSETVAENVKDEIRSYVHWADRVISLGFSFANVNMALFPLPGINHARSREVVGTCFEMSGPNQEFARDQLNRPFDASQGAVIANVKSAKLFDDFELRLS
jgi:hypothetical protein